MTDEEINKIVDDVTKIYEAKTSEHWWLDTLLEEAIEEGIRRCLRQQQHKEH